MLIALIKNKFIVSFIIIFTHFCSLLCFVGYRNASLHEKLFLRALLAEFGRTGVEEAVFRCVYRQHTALCRFDGIHRICAYLETYIRPFNGRLPSVL